MMQRYDFLKSIAADSKAALAVSTGWAAREWWALRPSEGNLKTRTLGLVSSVAAGLALALPHRKVVAIDGDGAFLMNLCGLPTIALQRPPNLIHLVFDNECYAASGSIATASRTADAVALAKAAGYKYACWVENPEQFRAEFLNAWKRQQLTLIAAKVDPGQPAGLPALRMDEIENKYRFMRYLEETENKVILSPGFDSKA
jgi:thiamine pyrophosphate-dependent acetolactate synthase large subunit-like protein